MVNPSIFNGRLSMEEIKAEYKKRGYSILAASDHDALHSHYALSAPRFCRGDRR